jgi:hypothetical protein
MAARDLRRTDTPVGQACLHCQEAVGVLDEGYVFHSGAPIHMECLVRMTVGSVAYQHGRWSCNDGTEGDPPGMTKREAAKAAHAEFSRLAIGKLERMH